MSTIGDADGDHSRVTSAEAQREHKKCKIRRELFLEWMEYRFSRKRRNKRIARRYFKPAPQDGRPAYPLTSVLRVHCLQLFFSLRDLDMENVLRDRTG